MKIRVKDIGRLVVFSNEEYLVSSVGIITDVDIIEEKCTVILPEDKNTDWGAGIHEISKTSVKVKDILVLGNKIQVGVCYTNAFEAKVGHVVRHEPSGLKSVIVCIDNSGYVVRNPISSTVRDVYVAWKGFDIRFVSVASEKEKKVEAILYNEYLQRH